MKKKDSLTKKDKEDWSNFLKDTSRVPDKDQTLRTKSVENRFRFDLHGLSLDEANKRVKEIVKSCSEKNYKEILFITGKGIHSTSEKDVFVSKDLGKLKFSVPEFIKSDIELNKLILSINDADIKDGGEGAMLVKLKNFQKNQF